jgi:hypothetical protein
LVLIVAEVHIRVWIQVLAFPRVIVQHQSVIIEKGTLQATARLIAVTELLADVQYSVSHSVSNFSVNTSIVTGYPFIVK